MTQNTKYVLPAPQKESSNNTNDRLRPAPPGFEEEGNLIPSIITDITDNTDFTDNTNILPGNEITNEIKNEDDFQGKVRNIFPESWIWMSDTIG